MLSSKDKFSLFKVLLLCLVIYESDGLVSRFLGLDAVLSSWAYAGAMVLFTVIAFFLLVNDKSGRELNIFFYPILIFAVFIFVSLISAGFLYIKPIKDWLPSLYQFTPIFVFYFLYLFKYNCREIALGLIVVSISVSMLLLYDQFSQLEFLNEYMRRSAFFSMDGRRIVLLKNEVIFGFVTIVSIIITGKEKLHKNKLLIALALFVFLVQAFIMESRLGFLAMVLASIVLLYLKGVTSKTLQLCSGSLLAILLIFPSVFNRHIDSLSQMSINDSTSNISIRFETVEHYYKLYLDSYGLGFGAMSANSKNSNVLNMAEHYNIVDSGAFSALFQFGPLGLIAWVFLTIQCLKIYKKYYYTTNKVDPYSASVFAFLIAFTFSPLPLSFFTSSWCINVGGILLYLAWFYRMQMLSNIKEAA